MATEFNPNYAVHVGKFLKDALEAHHMKQSELAEKIGVSKTIVNEIVKGKRGINAHLAVSLEPIFGFPASFWLNIQSDYDVMKTKKGVLITNEEIQCGKYSALDVAYWFINRAANESYGEYLTPLKLQKLLYYAQALCIILTNSALFNDRIEHWNYGPVVISVYHRYKKDRTPLKSPPKVFFDKNTESLLEEVYNRYGIYSAGALVSMTHKEKAWTGTKENEEISPELIKNTFNG